MIQVLENFDNSVLTFRGQCGCDLRTPGVEYMDLWRMRCMVEPCTAVDLLSVVGRRRLQQSNSDPERL